MIPDHAAAALRELTRLLEADGHYWCDHAKGVFRCSAPQEPAQSEPAKEPDGPTEEDLSATKREIYKSVRQAGKTMMTDAIIRRQFGLPPREPDETLAPQKPAEGEPAEDTQDQSPDDTPDADGDGGGL